MKRLIRENSSIFILLGLMGVIMLNSCDKDDDTEPQNEHIEQILIIPQNASIAVGEQLEFSTVGITTDGDTLPASGLGLEWNWWSTDPYVFTVDNDGTATGQNPGEAFCILDFTESTSRLKFNGRDTAIVFIF